MKKGFTAIHCKKYKKFPKTAPEQYKHRTYVGMKKGLTNECHVWESKRKDDIWEGQNNLTT